MNYRLENNTDEIVKGHRAAGKHPNGRAFLSINSDGAITYIGTEMGMRHNRRKATSIKRKCYE